MNATLTFPTKELAENFAKEWSRHTLNGHTISGGDTDVKVSIYNITDEHKKWIDNYVLNLNS